ncbi:hypothetical protein GCM10022419_019920 [Nonomuraea rosea]|uniref:Uncharacterized protein n=1 Tax=Nonomuraea rosea TaxID=638574 RepID=A0ABP6VWD1_9ACTN
MGQQRDRRLQLWRERDEGVGLRRAFDEQGIGPQAVQLRHDGPRGPRPVMPHAQDEHIRTATPPRTRRTATLPRTRRDVIPPRTRRDVIPPRTRRDAALYRARCAAALLGVAHETSRHAR